MYVSNAVVNGAGDLILETHEVRGIKALTASLVVDLFCTHDGKSCNEAFCLVSPPDWPYRVGVGHRFSLGSRLWHLGQWALCMDNPLVYSESISEDVAIDAFGWDRELLDESLSHGADDE